MFLTYANNSDKETKDYYSYLPKSLTNLCMYIFLGCIIEPPASTSSPSILMVANRPPIVFASYKSIFKVPFNNSVRKCEADAPPMPPPIMAKKQRIKLNLNFLQISSDEGRKINSYRSVGCVVQGKSPVEVLILQISVTLDTASWFVHV